MSKITPVASPSPPLRSLSRHQSPQSKHNSSESSIHRKLSDTICESPTDFQLLATKTTDSYQDDEPFSANSKKTVFYLAKSLMSNRIFRANFYGNRKRNILDRHRRCQFMPMNLPKNLTFYSILILLNKNAFFLTFNF